MKEQKNQRKEPKKTCLYGIGYVRQKGDWLNALRQFAGRTWFDLDSMEAMLREQLDDGSAYVDRNGRQVAKDEAAFIRLKTNVIVDAGKMGGESRFVVIKFRKNKYDMWEGLDFEYGDVASKEDIGNDEKTSDKADPLLGDVFFADKEGWKIQLKELAVSENWDNGRDQTGTGLLFPYLRYTYARLKEDGKIEQNELRMVFNTGLVSRETLDPVIAVCGKNSDPKHSQEWCFERFIVWGDADKVDPRDAPVRQQFPHMPRGAEWLKDAERTILRPELVEESGIDDVFKKLFEKSIPLELLERIANDSKNTPALKRIGQLKEAGAEKTVPDDEDKLAYGDLLNKMGGKADVIEIALALLRRALAMAKKRLEWEVVTAVPMYAAYRKSERITFSFMLPVSFDEKDPMHVDLAVVLDPQVGEGGTTIYRPQYLLKLDYAYSNARLLCRPSAEWLRNYRDAVV